MLRRTPSSQNRRAIALCAVVAGIMCVMTPAFAADTLCPEIDSLAQTPGSVSGVQADIERLNLCVERAKLLRELDEVVVKRKEMINKARQPSTAMMGTGLGMIPPLPVGSLPVVSGIDPQDLRAGETRITGPGGAPLQAVTSSLASPREEWTIRKIWGQGVGMNAQLTDARGTLLNVQKGQPLPNGMMVESISVRGVTVSDGGKIIDLMWDDTPIEQADTKGRSGGRSGS